MIINHGNFTIYTPVLGADHPYAKAKVLFLRNSTGVDFYSIAHAAPEAGRTFATVRNARVISVSFDPSSLWPIDCDLLETDEVVQSGYVYDAGVLAPYVAPLAAVKAAAIAAAVAQIEKRIAAGQVSVVTTAGTHSYGIDRGTQDNVMKVALGVVLGITPLTRPWTPKGASAPITVTHADILAIAGAVGNAYDANVQAYLVHKAAIMALTTAEAVTAYDVTAGWPV